MRSLASGMSAVARVRIAGPKTEYRRPITLPEGDNDACKQGYSFSRRFCSSLRSDTVSESQHALDRSDDGPHDPRVVNHAHVIWSCAMSCSRLVWLGLLAAVSGLHAQTAKPRARYLVSRRWHGRSTRSITDVRRLEVGTRPSSPGKSPNGWQRPCSHRGHGDSSARQDQQRSRVQRVVPSTAWGDDGTRGAGERFSKDRSVSPYALRG